MADLMLNVYKKFNKPEELLDYEEKYPFLVFEEFRNDPSKLTESDKAILSKNIDVIKKDPLDAYLYARDIIKGRFPEGEATIMKDPISAFAYARDIIKGRWEKAEPVIMKHPRAAYNYALSVIKGRWEDAEDVIMKDPIAYDYVKRILSNDPKWMGTHKDGRWYEAEPYIMKDPFASYDYARDIIKGRWEEAEPIIQQNQYKWGQYKRYNEIE